MPLKIINGKSDYSLSDGFPDRWINFNQYQIWSLLYQNKVFGNLPTYSVFIRTWLGQKAKRKQCVKYKTQRHDNDNGMS